MSNLIPLSRGILSLNDIRAIWSRDPQPSNTSYLDRRYTINIRYVNVTHHFVYDYTTEAERNKDLGEIWDCLNDTDRAHIYKPVMTEEEEDILEDKDKEKETEPEKPSKKRKNK